MGKLVAIAQSLLDILKWLMEGSNRRCIPDKNQESFFFSDHFEHDK